MIISMIKKLLS